MLSYRHGFHAGNFADVLKHITLVSCLNYLTEKAKPLCYIDTHSGSGRYGLSTPFALKNREFDNGIGRLWQRDDLPEAIAHYVAMVKHINPNHRLLYYPGSPLLAHHLLRKNDHLFLHELHTTEAKNLAECFERHPNVSVFHANGLIHSLGLLPPSQRRGLILIDPAYEKVEEYQQVVKTLKDMVKRFANGTYLLWYPVIERSRQQHLERALLATGIKNMHLFELGITADHSGYGMTACGIIAINPPWVLPASMYTILPYLVKHLGDNKGFYHIKLLVGE
jgi:23S rRNA (adenine2030-N6)-methyltransferase